MPKVTATYWKHDESQDEGDDVTMTVYELLVDYVTDDLCIPEIDMCTLHVVKFWRDNIEWYNICSKENINRHNFFVRSRIAYRSLKMQCLERCNF